MSNPTTTTIAHPDWDTLVDYWLGDTDAVVTEAIDEHLMHCDACGTAFDEVVALSRGVRDTFAHGAVPSMLTAAFVDRLKAAGRRVREYRVPHNGSVLCSVAPDDDLLVSWLAAPLRDVTRLDAVFAVSLMPGHEKRLEDVPFDAAGGEVVFAPKLAEVLQHPTHDFTVRLIAVDETGERQVGHYTFHHQAAR
jgi:hypothetical protein